MSDAHLVEILLCVEFKRVGEARREQVVDGAVVDARVDGRANQRHEQRRNFFGGVICFARQQVGQTLQHLGMNGVSDTTSEFSFLKLIR